MRYAIVGGLIASLMIAGACADEPATKPAIRIADDTTFFKGPLKSDGTIDYAEAIDVLARKGVTPENNFVALFYKATGTGDKFIPPAVKAETLKRLGIGEETGKEVYCKDLTPEQISKAEDDVIAACDGGPCSTEDHKTAAAWIATDSEAVELFIEASKRDHFYAPLVVGKDEALMTAPLPYFSHARTYANLLCARAMFRLGSGNVDGCIADLAVVHRAGRLLSQGTTLIEHLTGMAIDGLASTMDMALVASGKLTAKQARGYLAQWEKLPTRHDEFMPIHVHERVSFLDAIMYCRRKGIESISKLRGRDEEAWPADLLKRAADIEYETILKRGNALFDEMIVIERMNDPVKRKERGLEFIHKIEEIQIHWNEPKDITGVIGNLLIGILFPDYTGVRTVSDKSLVNADLAHVGLALAAYHAEKNAYPDSLDALVPGSLTVIPIDRFSTRPLIYKKQGNGFLLYSVGENLKDDGGTKPPESDRRAGDIVLQTDR